MVKLLVYHDGSANENSCIALSNDPVVIICVMGCFTIGVMAKERGAKLYATDERYNYL